MNILKSMPAPIAERLRSPIYGPFIVSWLICNWKIIFVTIFPERYQLGNLNLAEYISLNYLHICNGLVYPLLLTVCYIFILPRIEYYIRWYREKEKRKTIDKRIEILKEHSVPGNEYYELQMQMEKERESVIKFNDKIKEAQALVTEKENDVSRLQGEIVRTNTESQERRREFFELQARYNMQYNRNIIARVFEGVWRLVYTVPGHAPGTEEFIVIGNSYQIMKSDGTKWDRFTIKLFDFDSERKTLNFVKYLKDQQPGEGHCVNELIMVSPNRFEGKENEIVTVVYTKLDITEVAIA